MDKGGRLRLAPAAAARAPQEEAKKGGRFTSSEGLQDILETKAGPSAIPNAPPWCSRWSPHPRECNSSALPCGDLISSPCLPQFPNYLRLSPGREGSSKRPLTPPSPGGAGSSARTDPSRDGVGGGGVGPASAAARRRLGRAPLLRFGANYKVAAAAASPGTARGGEAGAPRPAVQPAAPRRH